MTPSKTAQATLPENLVRMENVTKHFPVQSGFLAMLLNRGHIPAVHAADEISFNIRRGEVFGLAGESGSGKSTVGRLVLRLHNPTSGHVIFDGIDLNLLDDEEMRRMRSRMQLVFQDPLASLNPRMTIGQAILHPVTIHMGELSKVEQQQRVLNILSAVGMNPPESFFNLFPHQISGGQRQRIVLARALVTNPELIVADEPIAMADVSVRSLLLELMMNLKKEFDLTYLFITHDLATAKYICNRIGIMYLGKLMEMGDLREVYSRPLHPYTQALLAAVPVPDPEKRRTQELPKGEIPNPIDPPSGCRFHPRCTIARKICAREEPVMRELLPHHTVACHFADQFK
ncbi:MAG: ABC transporter ATP-binding protein [Anaerolineaceae bacterium]|nr:ABC transporter ATP-binding protein [Anaerolineaceae bacterium]MBN2677844.1 ABC transporter ATP-binding protein [Anaerolineaceae bacterium]